MPDVIQIAIQATDLASKVIGGVGDSLDKLDKSADSAEKKLKVFGLTTDQIGSKMSQAGKIATVGLTVPIAGLAAASIKAASDLNETANKIDTLFGSAADEIKKFSDTAATSLGQSKKQALDAAATFAVFGKSAGLAGQDLVKFSEQNVTLAADMASFFNTSPEEAITAIGAAFRGESEPIRRYGVLLDDASLKQQALRMGLIKTTTEALQPQQRVLAAQALIMQQTSAAAGDFAKTSGGLANQTRILEAQFQDVVSTLGQSLLPIAVQVASTANDLLTAFNNLDQPTKDLIVGFGLMAAAAGPVLTIGSKLIGVFGSLTSIAIDVGSGMISVGKTIGETAGYLKDAGLSVDNLKFAFQNLKGAGVILGAELGIIVAGLIAVAKYLGEVDAASKATNDSLIEMSHSGDVFKQAAATTEILTNGQERLKKTLDDVKTELESSKRTYADYRSSIEATAKAAGYEIDAQGNLVSAMDRGMGAGKLLIQTNYALSESEYAAGKAAHERGGIIDQGIKKLIEFGKQVEATTQIQQKTTGTTKEQIEGYKALAEARTRTGDAEKDYQAVVKETMDTIKAQNGVIADAYSLAITYTEGQRKQAEVQAELDKLNQDIAARGPARTVQIKNEKLSTDDLARAQLELAVVQEDLATAKKKSGETDAEFALRVDTIKGKIADYSTKLGEHTVVVGGATKAELEHKAALEAQIAALQKTDEITRAQGAFDSLSKAFRDGVLTQSQYEERMTALNKVTGLYTEGALAQATAQEVLMKSFADPSSELWRGQLLKNADAIDGQINSTKNLVTETDAAREAMSKAIPVDFKIDTTAAKNELDTFQKGADAAHNAVISLSKEPVNVDSSAARNSMDAFQKSAQAATNTVLAIPKEVTTTVKAVIDIAQGEAGESMKERLRQLSTTVTTKVGIDTTQAEKDLNNYTANKINLLPGVKKTEIVADTAKATTDTNSILNLYGLIPATKKTTVDVEGQAALQMLDDILKGLNDLYSKTIIITTKYVTEGEPATGKGYASGANFVVPAGYPNDSFPLRVSSGERVIVQPQAQQGTTSVRSGDVYNYTTNVYNPLAAAMLADKQRRDKVARSNARMGVNVQ